MSCLTVCDSKLLLAIAILVGAICSSVFLHELLQQLRLVGVMRKVLRQLLSARPGKVIPLRPGRRRRLQVALKPLDLHEEQHAAAVRPGTKAKPTLWVGVSCSHSRAAGCIDDGCVQPPKSRIKGLTTPPQDLSQRFGQDSQEPSPWVVCRRRVSDGVGSQAALPRRFPQRPLGRLAHRFRAADLSRRQVPQPAAARPACDDEKHAPSVQVHTRAPACAVPARAAAASTTAAQNGGISATSHALASKGR